MPTALWDKAKERASLDGRPLRHILIDLLRYYVEHGLPPFKKVN